jgi:hypothetical protein
VEQSGTEIAANDLTRSFYGGACPNKKNKEKVRMSEIGLESQIKTQNFCHHQPKELQRKWF